MLVTPVATFALPLDWFAEPKWDGIRAFAARDTASTTVLHSRTCSDLSAAVPEITEALQHLWTFDGELVVWEESRLAFERPTQRLHRLGAAAQTAARLGRPTTSCSTCSTSTTEACVSVHTSRGGGNSRPCSDGRAWPRPGRCVRRPAMSIGPRRAGLVRRRRGRLRVQEGRRKLSAGSTLLAGVRARHPEDDRRCGHRNAEPSREPAARPVRLRRPTAIRRTHKCLAGSSGSGHGRLVAPGAGGSPVGRAVFLRRLGTAGGTGGVSGRPTYRRRNQRGSPGTTAADLRLLRGCVQTWPSRTCHPSTPEGQPTEGTEAGLRAERRDIAAVSKRRRTTLADLSAGQAGPWPRAVRTADRVRLPGWPDRAACSSRRPASGNAP